MHLTLEMGVKIGGGEMIEQIVGWLFLLHKQLEILIHKLRHLIFVIG